MTTAKDDARAAVREAMLARTAYWYNAVTCDDETLRTQIEAETAEADDQYERNLDAYGDACAADAVAALELIASGDHFKMLDWLIEQGEREATGGYIGIQVAEVALRTARQER